jgi:hypothetical protein
MHDLLSANSVIGSDCFTLSMGTIQLLQKADAYHLGLVVTILQVGQQVVYSMFVVRFTLLTVQLQTLQLMRDRPCSPLK